MGMYSRDDEFGIDMDALVESFLVDDLAHNYSEETVHEFCAPGGVADALLEAKVLSNKSTVIRLDKKADEARRVVIAAIQMAKAHNDPLCIKLIKYNLLRKQTKQKILNKYGPKARRAAIAGQKKYMKAMKGVNLSTNINQIANDANR